MPFEDVRNILITRLFDDDRGDRGWFVITRLHVELRWLKGIAEYLHIQGAGGPVELSDLDYQRLAMIAGTNAPDPGIQLRRHHLLAMDKPLRLIRRPYEPRWREVELTEHGQALALAEDPAEELETVLSELRFATPPWISQKRHEQYAEFDVQAYEATRRVLVECDGYIDRDEFDFFVSRIRNMGEVEWAVDAIGQYRDLTEEEQMALRSEVRNRLPDAKEYSNWRDVALHTFSLFSLGTSMVREETLLRSTENWAAAHIPVAQRAEKARAELKMPEPADSEDLLAPPVAPATNDGTDAESFVAKVFRAQGWTVAFYTNRRGFGFDLWARKDDAAVVIEVKSSVGELGTIVLTGNEYVAALEHGSNYVLALVENLESGAPHLRLIENPAETLEFIEREAKTYTIARADWLATLA